MPDFILEQYAKGQFSGRIAAAALFVDISGFTTLSETFMQHGPEAAENLADMMQAVFDPLVEAVQGQGGFITGFAGDAFTALFKDEAGGTGDAPFQPSDATIHQSVAAALHIQQFMQAHPTQHTPYSEFPFAVKLGLAEDMVHWGIVTDEEPVSREAQAVYYFRGEAIEACAAAEKQAQPGELILTPSLAQRLGSALLTQPSGSFYRLIAINQPLATPSQVPPAPPDSTHLGAFLPRPILQQTLRGEFRPVLTLFINLQTGDDPSRLTTFIHDLFHLQQQYGGFLSQVDFGDKGCTLLLFWGMPTSYENDVERALNFALSLAETTPETFRIGITYRLMYAGFVGSSLRQTYSCYGRGVNLAARLMTAAPWGSTWMDEETAYRAQRQFTLVRQGALTFKGFADRQTVYALLAQRSFRPSELYQTPLAGRETELDQLLAFLQPLTRGKHAGAMVLRGEAGIGKSRLVYALRHHPQVRDMGLGWARCQTDQILRHPFNPFRYFLDGYLDQGDGLDATENLRRFHLKYDELIAAAAEPDLRYGLERGRAFIAALLDLYWLDSLYTHLSPETRFENTLDALKNFLKAESLRRPLIIQLEDAHWLDPETAQFLPHLLRNVEDIPFALLITLRPGQDELLRGLVYQVMDLAPLEEAALAQLAETILGIAAAPSLIDLLRQRAEGNPFFAEQMLLYLQEQGTLLREADGTVGLQTPVPDTALPADVRALLIARLDRLSQEVKNVVQTASVLGREFEVQLLIAMLQREQGVMDMVAAAEQAAIWSSLNQLRYLFKHTLLREAAYDMQLRTRRRTLHQLAGQALESVYAHDLTPHWGLLAYHFEQAGIVPKAVHYLEHAADFAREAYQNDAALDYYDRLIPLLQTPDHEPDGTTNLLPLVKVLLHKGEIHLLTGRWPEAEAAFTTALHLATQTGASGYQAEAQTALSNLLQRRGDNQKALNYQQQALALYEATSDGRGIAHSLNQLGVIYRNLGEYEQALNHHKQALQLSRHTDERASIARNLGSMAIVHEAQGAYEQSLACYREAWHISQEMGDPLAVAVYTGNMGNVYWYQGQYEQALTFYRQALQVNQEIGHKRGMAIRLGNMGSTYRKLGNYEQALACYRQALLIDRELGRKTGIAANLSNMGLIYSQKGEYEPAAHAFQQALRLDQEAGNRRGQAIRLGNLGQLHREQGELQQALGYYDQAIALCRQLGAKYYLAWQLIEKAEALFLLGQLAEAQRLNEEGVQIAATIQDQESLFQGRVLQARLLAAANQSDRAQSHLHELQQAFRELAQQARLFELLWQMGGNRRDGEAAAAAYRQLLRQVPSAAYQQRLAALEMVLLSQAQPALPLH